MLSLVVASSFITEPLYSPLSFWLVQMNKEAEIKFAPYNQVFQQLTDTTSLFCQNKNGFNLILIRFEDWGNWTQYDKDQLQKLRENLALFIAAINSARQFSNTPFIVCICPASPELSNQILQLFSEIEKELVLDLEKIPEVYVLTSELLFKKYYVENFYNAYSDELAHIPYTSVLYTALGTLIARKIYTLTHPAIKVIVVDCDDTLWKGTYAELGIDSIDISLAFQYFQKCLIQQSELGRLICLCSKNNEGDVLNVLNSGKMLLKINHITKYKINWQPKSKNIKELANELNLGLDSFVFIDNNPVECAEIESVLPEVTTLLFPAKDSEIVSFIKNLWIFDSFKLTEEDKKRTELYVQESAREDFRKKSLNLRKFIEDLKLNVEILEIQKQEIRRVSQLTQRTNQFNCTTIRYSEMDIAKILTQNEYECRAVHVKDRFGDYGLVGVIIFKIVQNKLIINTFLLSCRVLGRGIEHQIIAWLGNFALKYAVDVLEFQYVPTERNQPAFDFLNSIVKHEPKSSQIFTITVERAIKIYFDPETMVFPESPAEDNHLVTTNSGISHPLKMISALTTELCTVELIQKAIRNFSLKEKNQTQKIDVPMLPKNDYEQQLLEILKDVLGLNMIGIHDNFFDLGMNSLLGVQICSKIYEELFVKLDINDLFDSPSVFKLASVVYERQKENWGILNKVDLLSFPLSFYQLRIWFLQQLLPNKSVYNVPTALYIKGELDILKIEKAINILMSRQHILRNVIAIKKGENEPQQITKDIVFNLNRMNLCHYKNKERINKIMAKICAKPFNLQKGPLIKGYLLQIGEQEYYLMIIMHHMISDEYSWKIFYQELCKLYNLKDMEDELEKEWSLPVQYVDFAVWHRNWLSGMVLDEQLFYWKEKLSGAPKFSGLPVAKYRLNQPSYKGAICKRRVDKITLEAITTIGRMKNASLFMTLLSVFYVLLYRYTNQEDIVIGTPIANRHYPGIQKLIGFFVNTLALRVHLKGEYDFNEVVRQVRETALEAYAHQDLPFDHLVKHLKLTHDISNPLFQIMFILKEQDKKELNFNGLEIKAKEVEHFPAMFDITLQAEVMRDFLELSFIYSTDLFDEEIIEQFAEHFLHILFEIANEPNRKIDQIRFFSIEEEYKILEVWNNTETSYPFNNTIQTLFEQQVEKTPDNIALVFQNSKLTYRQLNEISNQLAFYLKQIYPIRPDTPIAIFLERNEYLLIAIIAVFKSGGAYVPIDPSYPNERIKFILSDTKAYLVLTNDIFVSRLKEICKRIVMGPSEEAKVNIFPIDNKKQMNKLLSQPINNFKTETTSTSLAAIIYTSGTEDHPKGVMLEHRGIINTVLSLSDVYDLNKGKRVAAFSSCVFDVFLSEFLVVFFRGGELHLLSDELRADVSLISQYIIIHNINYIYLPPALLNHLPRIKYDTLKGIIYAGESCDAETGKYWSNSYKLYNYYGPTETTIYATGKQVINGDTNLIGTPISNTTCYVLSKNLDILPIGLVGELYIGGIGLARGYINRPELTAEKFITVTFPHMNNAKRKKEIRLYKTGDLVRWLPNGNLEFIGRSDFQVKIRGIRIELGEIESALNNYGGITQSVVLVRDSKTIKNGNGHTKYLIGYYVSDRIINVEDIFNYLRLRLPEYMIPNRLIRLDKFPLSATGKIDRKLLPEPDFFDENNYIAPRNDLENELCKIWSELLGLPQNKISVRDDFFKLGGDSIISIQLVLKLRGKFNISVKDVFVYKTIERLCDNVLTKKSKNLMLNFVEEEPSYGEVPLLPIQQWFFNNNFSVVNHWNQSFIVKVPPLDLKRLQTSIDKLVTQHGSFKLRYKNLFNHYIQFYTSDIISEKLKILNIKTIKAKEGTKEFQEELQVIYTSWQSEFDLEKGPIYAINYIYGFSDGSARIFFALHHLIVDSMSWKILMEDLRDIYNHKNIVFKGSSYKQWVKAVNQYSDTHENEKKYWANVLADYHDIQLNNFKRNMSNINHHCSLELEKSTTLQLLRECNQSYNTQISDILLTALAYTLTELTNHKINHIMLEGHGREEIFDGLDVKRTLGWFTVMYPVRLEVDEQLGISIKRNKEHLRLIPNKGLGFGTLMGFVKTSLPKVSFNYLGQFIREEGDSNWNIINEKSGISIHPDNVSCEIIHINGIVIDGKFKFNIISRLGEDVTFTIANLFKEKLIMIINHCVAKKTVEYTMSDFDDFEPYVIFNDSIEESPYVDEKALSVKNGTIIKWLAYPFQKVKSYVNLFNQYQRNTLFMFPPGEGGAESYFNNLLQKLNDRKLVIFNSYFSYLNHKLGIDYTTQMTFEKLADEHICYIKSIQSQGPYYLFGWSFGGVLACEVARQLINSGHRVASIVLIDPFFNYQLAISKTNTRLNESDYINYKYAPSSSVKISNTNIVLFKALRIEDSLGSIDISEIYRYYVENAEYNNLEYLFEKEKIKLVAMNHDHSSWKNSDTQIEEISKALSPNFLSLAKISLVETMGWFCKKFIYNKKPKFIEWLLSLLKVYSPSRTSYITIALSTLSILLAFFYYLLHSIFINLIEFLNGITFWLHGFVH